MESATQNTKVLGEIALSLSGGGYRAAAFHLGTLEMLDELELLDDVTVLSTVSGGTIIGAAYAAAVSDGLLFAEFKKRFCNFLTTTNVISVALAGLKKSVSINGKVRMPSLIRAAADVYARDNLLGGRKLGSLAGTRFKDLAFNTTEFRIGNSFRFQVSTNKQVRSGNNNAEIDPKINDVVRLADVVAASSCFPSGFEPIRFPSDFVWDGDDDLPSVTKELGPRFENDIPLMDGGVFDNQGIDSIKNIYDRKDSIIGTFIISDTSPRRSKPFEFTPKDRKGAFPLWLWFIFLILLFLASILSMTAILMDMVPLLLQGELRLNRGIFLYLIPFLFSLVVFIAVLYGTIRIRQFVSHLRETTGIPAWKYFRVLTMPEVIEFARSRMDSIIEMTTNTFMKRVRGLGYTSVFSDPKLKEKLIPNLIYDIDNEEKWRAEITDKLQPTPGLRAIVKKAESYKTNLWFLNTDDLDNLIACGRATVCFKILLHLLRHRRIESSRPGTGENELLERVKIKWSLLNGKVANDS